MNDHFCIGGFNFFFTFINSCTRLSLGEFLGMGTAGLRESLGGTRRSRAWASRATVGEIVGDEALTSDFFSTSPLQKESTKDDIIAKLCFECYHLKKNIRQTFFRVQVSIRKDSAIYNLDLIYVQLKSN